MASRVGKLSGTSDGVATSDTIAILATGLINVMEASDG